MLKVLSDTTHQLNKDLPQVTTSVYKYPLARALDTGRSLIKMPICAEILAAGVQDGTMCIWARIDKDQDATIDREFSIFGTGHVIPDDFKGYYVQTVFDGSFVWHVYVGPETNLQV